MYLYKPYLNNPITDGFMFGGGMLYPNRQNMESFRYNMFDSVVSEKIYNFWDRIGDLIAAYFPNLLKPREIYFAKVIEKIPEEYHKLDCFQFLLNFKNNEYVHLNNKRKQIVHYTSPDTDFKYRHIANPTNREEIETLIEARDSAVDFYKNQVELTFVGFEQALLLVEAISNNTLHD